MVADLVPGSGRSRVGIGHPRRRILSEIIGHLALLFGAVLLAGLLALAWLFVRTDRGALDVSARDGSVALAFLAASIPAWTAFEVDRVLRGGTTDERARSARRWSLLLHPVTVPAWLWLAGGFALPSWWMPATVAAAAGLIVLACALVSFALLLFRPDALAVHARLAGLVSRRRG